jgi:tetratricopeptide (TPR) repeat protein
LYDLQADPGELRNLATANPDKMAEMEADLAAREEDMVHREAGKIELDAAALEALQSLGYVDGAAPNAESGNLLNPVDMAHVVHTYRRAEAMLGTNRAGRAIELLEGCAADSPDSFVIVELLGRAYGQAGRLVQSQRLLENAISLSPDSAQAYASLAWTLGKRGHLKSALAACEEALRRSPDQETASAIVTDLQAARESQLKAIANLREKIKAEPESPRPVLRLSAVFVRTGQPEDAVIVLREGLAAHPDDPGLNYAMARLLATSSVADIRDGETAIALARKACEAGSIEEFRCLDTLAAAFAEAGRFEDAAETARKAVAAARQQGKAAAARAIAARARLYEDRKPYHEP